ncbi:CatB-related O-acetyltransferase [Tropicimonas sp. IMCC34011]|uniref:CatB-related O-acetyltransferase n=1 Tax=Tropicimonas sp. IMCC34011 TaxID=2248759 RepID=UPI000E27D12C|nr:CatB-related O-acetyltransferase [Tropicimonas sp. IMCC34011]
MPTLSDPRAMYPLTLAGAPHEGLVHLAAAIDHPNIEVGDHAYASSFDPPKDWAARLAPYLYPGAPERLRIGRFAQIGHGATFVTASANHPMAGPSTYPFAIFAPETMAAFKAELEALPDTEIGPDCWIGHNALILPGVTLGAGVIVGAGAVVAKDVPPYAIVAGNPARVIRMRYSPEEVSLLMKIAWWDRSSEEIAELIPHLASGDVAGLACAVGL